jgi:hypothetical protein
MTSRIKQGLRFDGDDGVSLELTIYPCTGAQPRGVDVTARLFDVADGQVEDSFNLSVAEMNELAAWLLTECDRQTKRAEETRTNPPRGDAQFLDEGKARLQTIIDEHFGPHAQEGSLDKLLDRLEHYLGQMDPEGIGEPRHS